MWAQLITTRLKPGTDDQVQKLFEHLDRAEQADSGLVRTTAFRDQNDPGRVYMLAVFESEEKARSREQDPRRDEGLAAARTVMAEIFDGPPEFTDLTVIHDKVR